MIKTDNNLKILKYSTICFSILVIMFGLSAILGLYLHVSSLYRYTPNSVSIVFNSALSFIIFGIVVLTCIYKYFFAFYTLIAVVGVNAILVLLEHIYDINIGIDQLFFTHYDSLDNAYPGRMAPNTAVCFLLSSIALLFQDYRCKRKIFVAIGCTFSMIVLTLGIVFFIGYINTIFDTFLWGNKTPMSKAASCGFILLGINLLLMSFYNSVLKAVILIRYIPIVLSLCIIITTIILANEIYAEMALANIAPYILYITVVFGVLISIMCGLFLHFLILAGEVKKVLLHARSVLQSTLESTTEGIVVVSLRGEIVAYNQRFLSMWAVDDSSGFNLNRVNLTKVIVSQLRNHEEYYLKRRQFIGNLNYQGTDFLELTNGNIYERHIMPQMINNKVVGRVFSYRDITAQRRLEAELLHQSTYDMLTELPNRALMIDLSQRAISSSKNAESNKVVMFLIDVDKFSNINDLFGRSKGDQILQMVASRLQSQVNDDCVLGRIGGDEFLLLHTNINNPEYAVTLIRNIIVTLEEPFDILGNKIPITVCCGIAFYPKDGNTVDELLANADIAMLRAKTYGRSSFQFYASNMNEYTLKHMQMETLLRDSLNENKFIVYYQPIIDLKTLKTVGVEALVRLKDKNGVIVPPGDFIPLAESLGLIKSIGEIVLKEACRQAKIWHDAGMVNLVVAINISAHQFKFGTLSRTVNDVLKSTGVNPAKIELELTESAFLNTSDDVVETLRDITKLGIRLSIDDFGTGFSSFNYIKRFNIDKIKIDQSFVRDAITSKQDCIIVGAMVAMGKNLQFTILAEGIETLEQQQLMTQLGCTQGQGFLFAKPMPADECTKFLRGST